MKFDILQFNFFNTELATDQEPFLCSYLAEYKLGKVDDYLREVFKDIEILEISNEVINTEYINTLVNSKYYNNSLTINLKVNDFMSFISVNLNDSGFSGTIMVDACNGFHYALIMSDNAVKEENEKLMASRKLQTR